VANISFSEPIVIEAGTGVTVNLSGVELFGKQSRDVEISIGQIVAKTSDVVFNQLTTSPVIIDNGNLRLNSNTITGSFTQTGNLIFSSNFTSNGNLTVDGTLTAEKIETEYTQSVTLFESGSTVFGDTLDDTHHMTGSMLTTGSLTLNAYKITEISDDTSLTDGSSTAIVTENAIETYANLHTKTINTYNRKSFAYTGSFVSVSTASFSALSASAPSGYTGTTVHDFMFFLNGVIMENDSLNIEQSGSTFLLKVNNSTLGYNLEAQDEIVSFGKFNS